MGAPIYEFTGVPTCKNRPNLEKPWLNPDTKLQTPRGKMKFKVLDLRFGV
jgi:hypothetical protein